MPATFTPTDGRLTSLQTLNTPLLGDEVMYLVSPGNAELGNSYKVTIAVLGAYFQSAPVLTSTVILAGATLASPYNLDGSFAQVLFNKTVASASYAVAALAASFRTAVLIKDIKGNADVYPIQISFSGGELCDGLSTLTIGNPYGWTTINPVPSGGAWYQS